MRQNGSRVRLAGRDAAGSADLTVGNPKNNSAAGESKLAPFFPRIDLELLDGHPTKAGHRWRVTLLGGLVITIRTRVLHSSRRFRNAAFRQLGLLLPRPENWREIVNDAMSRRDRVQTATSQSNTASSRHE